MAMPPTFVTVQHRPRPSEFTFWHGIVILLILMLAGWFVYQAVSPDVHQERRLSETGAILRGMARVQNNR
jgi:hypothetical protein